MFTMILPLALALLEYVNVLVALCALALAVKWQRMDFFPGLFFLLLYTIIDAIELTLAVLFDVTMINASQFGFILLALAGFILGMRPADHFRKSV